MTKAEELLKALTDEVPVDWWKGAAKCTYCNADVRLGEELGNTEPHKPDCPWRLAKEYLTRREGG